MNGENTLKYLAVKVIEDILNGKEINENLAKELNNYPIIDYIRAEIRESHLERLKHLINSTSSDDVRRLGISLLNNLIRDERNGQDIKDFLCAFWRKADKENKLYIMWKILDFPGLEKTFHLEIYDFVQENWEVWLQKAVDWCGGRDKVLDVVSNRLKDSSFPETKAWVYLCNAMGSPDKAGVRSLIQGYISSKHSIVSQVSDDLLNKLDS